MFASCVSHAGGCGEADDAEKGSFSGDTFTGTDDVAIPISAATATSGGAAVASYPSSFIVIGIGSETLGRLSFGTGVNGSGLFAFSTELALMDNLSTVSSIFECPFNLEACSDKAVISEFISVGVV